MSRASPSVDDGQLTLDLPEWRWEFNNPVVETCSNNYESIVHWPDLDSDEPEPACNGGRYGGRDDVDYTAKELLGGLAAFRRPCPHPNCMQPLVRKARELEVEFDG